MGINSVGASVNVGSYRNSTKIGSSSINNINVNFGKIGNQYVSKETFCNYEADLDYSNIPIPESEKKNNLFESFASTGAVGLTSVFSGILKLGENLVDGTLWLSSVGGQVVLGATSFVADIVGADAFSEKVGSLADDLKEVTMDTIAEDYVAQANKLFYENTELGRTINEASYLKYDSQVANKIQDYTGDAAKLALATAATVATGGAAAPLFALGFAMNAGESAEEKFQDTENRDYFKDTFGITINGVVGGLEMVTMGKMGGQVISNIPNIKNFLNVGHSGIKELGKNTLNNFGKSIVTGEIKSYLGTMAKNSAMQTFKDIDTYADAFSIISTDVLEGMETGEWNFLEMSLNSGATVLINFSANLFGEYTSKMFEDALTETFSAGRYASEWSSQPGITSDIQQAAEANRKRYGADFISAEEYYRSLEHVESNSTYPQNRGWGYDADGNWVKIEDVKRIEPDDLGITSCVTEARKNSYFEEIASYADANGNVRVNVGNSNPSGFEKYILGIGEEYGTFGVVEVSVDESTIRDYNFVTLGERDAQAIIDSAKGNGVSSINQFETDVAIPHSSNDRVILASYDVPQSDLGMPTGKELGSNKQRLPGGRLPNGVVESVHGVKSIDEDMAKSTIITIIVNGADKPIWSGSLGELKDLQLHDNARYNEIMYGN